MHFSTCGSQFDTMLDIFESVVEPRHMSDGMDHHCTDIDEMQDSDDDAAMDNLVEWSCKHGMRQVVARDDEGKDECDYNPDMSSANWTFHCCATNTWYYMEAGLTYWIGVTGESTVVPRTTDPRNHGWFVMRAQDTRGERRTCSRASTS